MEVRGDLPGFLAGKCNRALALEGEHALKSAALGERHERQVARNALEAQHAYRTEMDRLVETLSAGRCPPAGADRRSRGRRLSPADGL